MDSKDIINTNKIEKLNLIKSKNKFINIKSDYILKKLFDNMQKRISLKIIKCNFNIQKRLNININNYKDFSEKFSSIELEIIPIQNEYGPFIKIKEENKKYFHIYFNNNKEEIKKTELNKEDLVKKMSKNQITQNEKEQDTELEKQIKLFEIDSFDTITRIK